MGVVVTDVCEDVEQPSRRISGLGDGKKTVNHIAVTKECQQSLGKKSPQEQGLLEQAPGKTVCI